MTDLHTAAQQEPVATQMDVIVANLVREGINKHRARELAEYFIKCARPQAREPLTDEEIADYLGGEYHSMTEEELRFFRLGEQAAHGITGEKK